MFKYILSVSLMMLIISGCKESETTPLNKGDKAPEPVTNVIVENLAGGAKITYDRQVDKNLLYVKATYFIREGVEREVKVSYYQNSIMIEGFPDTKEYLVNLYSVSRGESVSAPVTVTVKPLTPPVESVFKTLILEETYGGAKVRFVNESEANIVITLLAADEAGEYIPAETYYTKREAGYFSARGFPSENTKFAVFIRDRWDNHSDTSYVELTPLYEKQLESTKFKPIQLQTDTYESHCCGSGIVSLWDNSLSNVFHTKPGTGLPQWFTIDLGAVYDLSRFKVFHRQTGQGASDGAYTGGDPKEFELWGSNDPKTDGSWDSWILIGEFNSVKPSGSPQGTVTTEDYQFAVVEGEDFDFPDGTPPVRYLRWKTKKVWGALDHHYIGELKLWGSDN